MHLRSLAVIAFIAIVGAIGIYFAQRPTVARGSVLAAELAQSNPGVRSLECDDEIPIGHTGATFTCRVEMKTGDTGRLTFTMDRAGTITGVQETKIRTSGDPWE
jgi:hypothetical protein